MVRHFWIKLFLTVSVLLSFGCKGPDSLNSDIADNSSGGTTYTITLAYDIEDDAEGADTFYFNDVPTFSAVSNFDLNLVDGVSYIATWDFLLAGSVSYVRLAGTGAIVDPMDLDMIANSGVVMTDMLHASLSKTEKVRLVIRDASNNLIVQSNWVEYQKIPPCQTPIWAGGAAQPIAAASPFDFLIESAVTSTYYDYVDVAELTMGKKVAAVHTYTDENAPSIVASGKQWTVDMSDLAAGVTNIRMILRDSNGDALCNIDNDINFN